MNTLDDITLIVQFVKQEGKFISNQNLRIEPAFDSIQLLTKRGGAIATIKTSKDAPVVSLRRNSEYWDLVNQSLTEHGFMPKNPLEKSEFIQYEKHEIPDGYSLHCTEAKILWKEWMNRVRYDSRNTVQTDLLIICNDGWHSMHEIVCSYGSLYITIPTSEIVYQSADLVVWLSKKPNYSAGQSSEKTASTGYANSSTNSNHSASKQNLRQADFIGKDLPQQTPLPPGAKASGSASREKQGNTPIRPDLREVIKFRQGKLYVTTAIGEVVIEGSNLKFWLNDEETSGTTKTVDMNTYRDRDAQAINT
jgi:hypothetical protein